MSSWACSHEGSSPAGSQEGSKPDGGSEAGSTPLFPRKRAAAGGNQWEPSAFLAGVGGRDWFADSRTEGWEVDHLPATALLLLSKLELGFGLGLELGLGLGLRLGLGLASPPFCCLSLG